MDKTPRQFSGNKFSAASKVVVTSIPKISRAKQARANLTKKLSGKFGRVFVLAAIVLIVVIVGLLVVVDGNLRQRIFTGKFQTYRFTNSAGTVYRLNFYTHATVKKYNFGNSQTNSQALVSPVLQTGRLPLALTIDGFPGNAVNASYGSVINGNNACSLEPASKPSFSVKILSLGLTAQFCSQDSVYYYSFFGRKGSTIYYMQIEPYDQQISGTSQSFPAAAIHSKPDINDLKTIIQSFRFVSKGRT